MENEKLKALDKMASNPGIETLKKAIASEEKCKACKNECCPSHPKFYKHAGDKLFQWCIECKDITKKIIQSSGTLVCIECQARRLKEKDAMNKGE